MLITLIPPSVGSPLVTGPSGITYPPTAGSAIVDTGSNGSDIEALQRAGWQVLPPPASLQSPARPKILTCIGDSIMVKQWNGADLYSTYGSTMLPLTPAQIADFYSTVLRSGVHKGASFTARACMRTNRGFALSDCVYGVNNASSAQILAIALPVLLANPYATKAGYCLVMAGTNDPGLGLTLNQTIANNQAICVGLLSAGILPILLSILPNNNSPAYIYQANCGLARLAEKLGIPFVDVWSPLANPSNGTWAQVAWNANGDNVHPSARGAEIMAMQIAPVLNTLAGPNGSRGHAWNSGTFQFPDPNFLTLAGAAINVAGSYPAAFNAPALTTKVNSNAGAEPGSGFTMAAGPTLAADALTPAYFGNSWSLTGDGTHFYVGSANAGFTMKPGDLILMSFRAKLIAPTSDATPFNAQINILDAASGNQMSGFNTADVFSGASVGNEAGYPAGEFIMYHNARGVGATLTVQLVHATNAGGAASVNDSMTLANLVIANLTAAGLMT